MAIQVALLGCGTVGGGVSKLLRQNQELITRRTGEEIIIKKVLARTPKKAKALGFREDQIVSDIEPILADSDIQIVIELIGGIEPSLTYIRECFKAGKHVVSANKDLIATYGPELHELAREKNLDFLYEASVGGGIPIIKPLQETMAGNQIQNMIGILNGTTNYILTRMSREHKSFEDILGDAQALGYAEANPTSDVDGLDAGRKLAILSSIAFNTPVLAEYIHCEGIRDIHIKDILLGKELGYCLKLVGMAKETDKGLQASVFPAFLAEDHPLSSVNDVFNALFITGDAIGDILLYGRGAGEMPTASSVVGDIIAISKNILHHSNGTLQVHYDEPLHLSSPAEIENEYYIRLKVSDKPMMLSKVSSILGKYQISIKSLHQKNAKSDTAEIIMITHQAPDGSMQEALKEMLELEGVIKIPSVIRVL